MDTWIKIGEFDGIGFTDIPRAEATCITHNKSIILFGGEVSSDIISNSILEFDTMTHKFHKIATSGDIPEPRSAHSAVKYGNQMYIFGGKS